jgi:hypothetical protein
LAGLGDRPLHPGLAGRELAGHQADERADAAPGVPRPISDLKRQSAPGRRTDTTQTPEPADDGGEFTVVSECLDCVIEPVPAGLDQQHVFTLRIKRRLRFGAWQVLPRQPRAPSIMDARVTWEGIGARPVTAHIQSGGLPTTPSRPRMLLLPIEPAV